MFSEEKGVKKSPQTSNDCEPPYMWKSADQSEDGYLKQAKCWKFYCLAVDSHSFTTSTIVLHFCTAESEPTSTEMSPSVQFVQSKPHLQQSQREAWIVL